MLWLGINILISRSSGWHALARKYRTYNPPPKNTKKFQGATIGIARYNGVLGIGYDDTNLYLDTFILFSFAHPPLRIPLSDIRLSKKGKILGYEFYDLTIGNPRITNLRIFKSSLPDMQFE